MSDMATKTKKTQQLEAQAARLPQEGVHRDRGYIYVTLPVCHECGRVSRHVGMGKLSRVMCRGPAGRSHPQAEMKATVFREQKKR